ncbi:MAG TPA: hypothetical protein ENL20_10485 [Candidatus Cloacimonetes bacterium]|nr:hypothetical protein [Candidatus Cloacimonadota bacterium]
MSNNPVLSWTSHPLKDFPLSSILLLIFILLISIGLWEITFRSWEMPLFFYLGMLVFIVTLFPYFIPTKYEFYDEKIVIFYFIIRIEKRYEDFGCFYADKKGVMLSTFKKPRRLDSFRGQSIRFSKDQSEKEELLKFLELKIGNKF